MVNDLKRKENISELEKILARNKSETFEWLKDCLTFIHEHNEIYYPSYEIIPNQEGDFKSHNNLSLDEIDDEELKKIVKLAGFNCYERLIHQDLYYEYDIDKKDIQIMANTITDLLKGENENKNKKLAITMLIKWFGNNEQKGKEYFSSLYNKKEKLLVDTIDDKEGLFTILNCDMEISDVVDMIKQDSVNIQKSEELDALFEEYGVSNMDELKKLISSKESRISPFVTPKDATSEVLASLGITNDEDFKIAKKSHPQLFHNIVPTQEMYEASQRLIKRAMKNIENYLKTLPDEYNCEDIGKTAPTVLGGIKKNGQYIEIVARPSDYKFIVIGYYESEIPLLELEGSELWYENGESDPQRMSLGKLLKTTKITRIPV